MITFTELLCTAVVAMNMPHADVACGHMETVVEEAHKNNLEAEVLVALIHEESRWKPWAVSKAGACGLTQVMPKYTRKPRVTCKQLKNAKLSIQRGAAILAYWVFEYAGGDYKIGLCGYNSGYRCRGKKKSKRSMAYARRVLRRARKLSNLVDRKRELLSIPAE